MVYSAKDVKDILPNIKEISESESVLALEVLGKIKQFANEMLGQFEKHLNAEESGKTEAWQKGNYWVLSGSYPLCI
jgi:hypothetical protein